MKKAAGFYPSVLKSFVALVLITFLLSACSGGGGGGEEVIPLLPKVLSGSAFVPKGSSPTPKTGRSKALPGSSAFVGATVNAKSLTSGGTFPGVGSIDSDGNFSIEGTPFGDDYIVSARKGNILLMKIVSVPADAASPFVMGEVDAASTAAVLMINRLIEEGFGRNVDLNEDIPGDIDLVKLLELLKEAQEDNKEADLRVLVDLTVNTTGNVKTNINLDIIYKDTDGNVDTDKVASINIYLTIQQILLDQGDPSANENTQDVINNWINGGSGNVIADTIINNFGNVTFVNDVVTPDNLKDNLDVITKPETTITGKPENPTPSTNARFSFISSREVSTFECKLDLDPFSGCSGPINYSELDLGPHQLCVVATDSDGNIDPTPACFEWTIDLPDVPINFAQDPPTAVTLPVGAVTTTSAVLASLINPEGTETRAYFEWGIDTNYGNTTALKEVGSGFSSIPISQTLIGLASATGYHFRVVSVNIWGITVGDDQSFVTD